MKLTLTDRVSDRVSLAFCIILCWVLKLFIGAILYGNQQPTWHMQLIIIAQPSFRFCSLELLPTTGKCQPFILYLKALCCLQFVSYLASLLDVCFFTKINALEVLAKTPTVPQHWKFIYYLIAFAQCRQHWKEFCCNPLSFVCQNINSCSLSCKLLRIIIPKLLDVCELFP